MKPCSSLLLFSCTLFPSNSFVPNGHIHHASHRFYLKYPLAVVSRNVYFRINNDSHRSRQQRIPSNCVAKLSTNDDMSYTRDTIMRQMQHFIEIKKAGKSDANVVNDVYVRDPKTNVWWYVGKVARCTGTVTLPKAISRQYNLIEEHACRLRPVELGRSFGRLEIWVAPFDSELRVARNDPELKLEQMDRVAPGVENVSALEVGFYCEYVTNQGEGFCVRRRDDGGAL